MKTGYLTNADLLLPPDELKKKMDAIIKPVMARLGLKNKTSYKRKPSRYDKDPLNEKFIAYAKPHQWEI